MSDPDQTKPDPPKFDFDAFPDDTLFFDRREGCERRRPGDLGEAKRPEKLPPKVEAPRSKPERRARKERRRRIDPTTFEKQYTDDEMEFMNAMQRFKVQSGKSFPSHGEVLRVAFTLGYWRDDLDAPDEADLLDPSSAEFPVAVEA